MNRILRNIYIYPGGFINLQANSVNNMYTRWSSAMYWNGVNYGCMKPRTLKNSLFYSTCIRSIHIGTLNRTLCKERNLISLFTKHRDVRIRHSVCASDSAPLKALRYRHKNKTVLIYLISAAVFAVGMSYAAVPLYRLYCQASGYGGTTQKMIEAGDTIQEMERIEDRPLRIRFEAGTSRKLQWKFKPQQKEVKLTPGETALAFYTAENLTDRPIIGISTYNVIPFDAGQYFNKIQCFCFEEQQLNPHEEVDMPVFFYIDPEFDNDPKMAKVEEIILSYTFFESNDGNLPADIVAGTH